MRYAYPCTLVPEDGGGFFVSFPDVPEALTGGADRLEALQMAEDALAVALGERFGVSESSVRKLINPEHRSHIGQVKNALRVLGRCLVVEDKAA